MVSLKHLVSAFCLALAPAVSALAETDSEPAFSINGHALPPVVAKVNGNEIPAQYLENQIVTYRLQHNQQGLPVNPVEEEAFARNALERLVDQEVLFQKQKELGLQVDQEKVNQEIERIAGEFPSKELFLNALSVQRLSMDMLRNSLAKKFIDDEFLRKKVAPNVKVSKDAVKKFYDAHPEQFEKPERFTIKHIFVAALEPSHGDEEDVAPNIRKKAERLQKMILEDAKAKIGMVHAKLEEGASFEELAKKYSEDSSSKDKGGLLGDVLPRTVFPEMAAWLPRLKPGQYSEPIQTPLGFHIMKLQAHLPKETVPLKQVETDILNHLLKQELEKARAEQLSDLRKSAEIQMMF